MLIANILAIIEKKTPCMLTLYTPYDAQLDLAKFCRTTRKRRKLSVKKMSELTTVPDSTIRRFESTGEISLRQLFLIYQVLGNLNNIKALIEAEEMPTSLDDVIRSQQ